MASESNACGGQSSVGSVNRLHPRFLASGRSGNDDLDGGRLADKLSGDEGADDLFGGAGADTLAGGSGDDSLRGSSGDDTLEEPFGGSADRLDGGTDTDVVTYADRTSPVTVTLDGVANDGSAGEGDNLISIEKVLGSSGADDLTGNDGANTLQGGVGTDEIVGTGWTTWAAVREVT